MANKNKMGALVNEPAAELTDPATSSPPPKASKTKKIKQPRIPFRQRITLSGMLLWTVLGAILMGGGLAGYYALEVLYENKLHDTWAILFLQLEQQGSWLTHRMEQFYFQKTDPSESPDLEKHIADEVLWIDPAGGLKTVSGDMPSTMQFSNFGLKSADLPARYTLVQYTGVSYLARKAKRIEIPTENLSAGDYLLLYRIDIPSWFAPTAAGETKNTFYLVTKEGKLLFSNRDNVTGVNYSGRPLVQKFISNPLRQGQVEFQSEDGPAYGFFYEAPQTNIMMFIETNKEVALAVVKEIAVRFSIVLFIILALTGLLLQFPITSLVIAPMRELIRVADEVGDGNFDVMPRREGLGELNVLSGSFKEMAKNLIARDARIQTLLLETKDKARLADELAIAHSIQNNFLLNPPLPADSGIEVAAQYTPAAEVAGDWYGYFYEPATHQSVFAIADVSGHGAGSAMFTAIIAAAFEETRETASQSGTLFPLDAFAVKLNRLILRLGHGKMHATLLVASYQKGKPEIHILNAGHPAPVKVRSQDSGVLNEPVIGQSDLLGIHADFQPTIVSVAFPLGTSLFMFTDGLIEGSPDHKLYSERRLNKAAKVSKNQSVNHMVVRIYEDWKDHLKGQPALDDVCLLAVRAAA